MTGTTTTDTTTTTTTAPATWYAGADAETAGWLQNRGWDKLDAKDAALNAVKSYREAEKHVGAPPDQLLRLPKDATDKDGWNRLYSKLGVPETPDKYEFNDVKFTDGTELDQDTVNYVRQVAADNHLTPDAAKAVAKAIVKLGEEAEGKESAEYLAKLEGEKTTLRSNWGSNAAANMAIAQSAANKLGISQEEINALEKTVGYSKVMEMFRNIGTRMGEDRFIGGGPGHGGVMTADAAKAQLNSLISDEAWVAKYEAGDHATVQQFHNLTKVMRNFVG